MAELADLSIERVMNVPRDLVWTALTVPEHLKSWWAPAPYQTTECRIDLRPGGIFFTRMRGPDGFDTGTGGAGCILEVVAQERLTWTSALGPGFRPTLVQADNCGGFPFTAIMTLDDLGDGRTRYRAVVLHRDEADRDAHAGMGFEEGWGTCAAQLEQVAAGLAEKG